MVEVEALVTKLKSRTTQMTAFNKSILGVVALWTRSNLSLEMVDHMPMVVTEDHLILLISKEDA